MEEGRGQAWRKEGGNGGGGGMEAGQAGGRQAGQTGTFDAENAMGHYKRHLHFTFC